MSIIRVCLLVLFLSCCCCCCRRRRRCCRRLFCFVQVESNFCNDLDLDLQQNAEANFFEDDPDSATTATTATTTETAAETTAETTVTNTEAETTTLEAILGMSPTVIKVEIYGNMVVEV